MGRDRARPYRGVEYAVLLAALLAMLVISAFVDETAGTGFRIVTLLVIVAGIFAISEHRAAIGLGVIFALVTLVDAVWPDTPNAVLISSAASIALDLLFISGIVYHIAREKRITRDLMIGAVCVYLLLGIVWLHAYRWMYTLNPDAFIGLDPDPAGVMRELLYFSFVTLTALGYGDIVPVDAPARTFAFLEGAAGQLVIAIFVARVVGLQLAGSRAPETGR